MQTGSPALDEFFDEVLPGLESLSDEDAEAQALRDIPGADRSQLRRFSAGDLRRAVSDRIQNWRRDGTMLLDVKIMPKARVVMLQLRGKNSQFDAIRSGFGYGGRGQVLSIIVWRTRDGYLAWPYDSSSGLGNETEE